MTWSELKLNNIIGRIINNLSFRVGNIRILTEGLDFAPFNTVQLSYFGSSSCSSLTKVLNPIN